MKVKPTIIIDWDETITIKDTIQVLSKIAYQKKPNFQPNFQHFQNLYLTNYHQYQQGKVRTNLHQEYEFQTGLKPIELSSINEISRLKLFSNLKIEDFDIDIPLKSGFIDFAKQCNQQNIPIIILSVNWTSLIMKYIMRKNGIHIAEYITNEFEIKDGITTGSWLEPNINTGIDKLNQFNALRKRYLDPIIYIGDSSTDLFCLLNADVGIVVENASILSSLNRLNIPVDPISTVDSRLYQANWKDIYKLIFEMQ